MAIRKNFQHFQRFFGAFAPPCARTVPRAFCLFPKKITPAGQTLHIVWRFACRSGRAVRPHCAVRLPVPAVALPAMRHVVLRVSVTCGYPAQKE
ncbi:MAG: hypothetical protein LUE95_00060, partial [Oscillospiraceae bacterium]|nr:hypothetical protein [Oscillospiraceae bacterium]